MDLSGIEAVIFDLGGVVLDIDIEGTFNRFKKIGIGLEQSGLQIIKTNNTFNRFEIGEIDATTFRNEIRKVSKSNFSDQEFDAIWNSMILDYSEDRIKTLEKVKSRYRTFLMSNTNEIHYRYYSKTLKENFGYDSLHDLFEIAYFSHTSGMRKPNSEFFEHILNENKLRAESTLFIDDFEENIAAADMLNIKTYHISNGKTIVKLFEQL